MKTVAMCFSIFQAPKCRVHTLASSWFESFHSLSRKAGNNYGFRIIASSTDGVKGKHSKAYNTRPISTKSGANKKTFISKTSDLIQDISDGSIEMGTKLDISNSEVSEFQRFQYGNVQQKTERSKELAKLLTIIVFDIETTGFSKDNDRIIEIALQDLLGGKESTFQTMVNPERYVPNQHIHGISTYKVNRPDVPRMQDLIPILMQYVKSRQKTGGQVLWIAHNARTFDVPFLIKEFSRCNFEIPLDWIFLDTIPLAREMMRLGGSKHLPPRLSLEALRKFYEIPLVGQAHRALSDVNTLSLILQRLTFDLKLPIYGLIERSFTVSDLIKTKKKKSGG